LHTFAFGNALPRPVPLSLLLNRSPAFHAIDKINLRLIGID
jgi:hypothetical protein